MKIEIFSRFSLRKMRRLWHFRVKAANGEIITQSEGVSNKHDAVNTIAALRKGLAQAEIIYL